MAEIPLILGLETATMGGSVFLGRGEEELAARVGSPQVSQSASLLNDISEVLAEGHVSLRDVRLFACASGPGSFTGLRIGIATLKALAASLYQPCVGIPTLHAVAHAAGPSPATVALLPAGRGEVFAQMFSVADDGAVLSLDTAAHLAPEKMVERYSAFKSLRWAGGGAQLQRDVIERHARENEILFGEAGGEWTAAAETSVTLEGWTLAAVENNLARHVAQLALQFFRAGKTESPDALMAIYVRPSDAELNQPCR
ncbi:MAG TPA: tRNA (adenosine(37)-N6)-threonylcarbamoyltransferase complex dimerization subunit type 1 TsaB [Pyrinomonadaceae bacterium]|jgi:tRNA threonylcarbamoyladenosine biosynthesis protein TsaB